MKSELILYVGQNCHLCDQAMILLTPILETGAFTLRKIDIATDISLETAYGQRIPVLQLPNGTEKGWPFSIIQIEKLLMQLN